MSEPAPEVSVVIAAWNAADHVAEAVRSALAQERVFVEVIVADDASTDDTARVVRAFDDPRVQLLRRERNGGPGAARNAAIAAAHGRWIAVLDADDRMEPGRLAAMLAAGKAADIVVDNPELVRPDGSIVPMLPTAWLAPGTRIGLTAFVEGNTPLRTRFNLGYLKPLFSRQFLAANGIRYDKSLRIGEDFILLAEALACGARCVAAGQCGYRYRVRENSTSHRLGVGAIDAMIRADRALLARRGLTASPAFAARARALASARAFAASVEAIKAGRWRTALRHLAARPWAAMHFRRPVAARMVRLGRRLGILDAG